MLAPTSSGTPVVTLADGYGRIADLGAQKTVSNGGVFTAGTGTVVYTIVVWNRGPADANPVAFADTVPSNVTLTGWTCAVSGTAVCSAASGANQASLNALTFNLPTNAAAFS